MSNWPKSKDYILKYEEPKKDVLEHYGIPRKSGRYPWGSGDNPYQSGQSFLSALETHSKPGMTNAQIAKAMGMTTNKMIARKTVAIAEERAANRALAQRLKDKGYSNVAVGKRMGVGESTVRSWLDDARAMRNDELFHVRDMLREAIDRGDIIDVGVGVERHLGITNTKLKTVVSMLEDEGYKIFTPTVRQVGTGHETRMKVIAKPEADWAHIYANTENIRMPSDYIQRDGNAKPDPTFVDESRIHIRYGNEGGADKDGIIELREGVDDISLGNSRYAQVRIGTDKGNYLKGVAIYSDDIPKGKDIVFNTPKSKNNSIDDILKPLELDNELSVFGASTSPKYYRDKDGNKKQSKINVIYEEGDWSDWSNNLSSQMLSKQRVPLAERQLRLKFESLQSEFDDISNLTNSAVRKRLLKGFAETVDSTTRDLKAAALPRQSSNVLLPFDDISEDEIYAPNYRNGESVVLIRYPHGGIFEIPQLIVNNRGSKKAAKVMKNAPDAVGINPKVAGRLSGADFDGDTVIVIPNDRGAVKVSGALKGLSDFEPQTAYPAYEGMPEVGPKTGFHKQNEMGRISNLITDMTVKGAPPNEIARAVRHSMVVIDAEKHNLNWKQSYDDNVIGQLKKRYQGGENRGASTIISKASAEARVPERKKYFDIDPKTGKKIYTETGNEYINKSGKVVKVTTKTTPMDEVDDAHKLSSGTSMEKVYANHANSMKALADEAWKSWVNTKNTDYSPEAKEKYKDEVARLDAKLNTALKNAPLERQAHARADVIIKQKRYDNPELTNKEIKRISSQALEQARNEVGAKKEQIEVTDKEWEAIQAGAVSFTKLNKILNNTDLERIKELATPRDSKVLTTAKLVRAEAMLKRGITMAEVADALGVSTSTIYDALEGSE